MKGIFWKCIWEIRTDNPQPSRENPKTNPSKSKNNIDWKWPVIIILEFHNRVKSISEPDPYQKCLWCLIKTSRIFIFMVKSRIQIPANIIQIPQATDLYGNDMDPYQGQDPDSDPY